MVFMPTMGLFNLTHDLTDIVGIKFQPIFLLCAFKAFYFMAKVKNQSP